MVVQRFTLSPHSNRVSGWMLQCPTADKRHAHYNFTCCGVRLYSDFAFNALKVAVVDNAGRATLPAGMSTIV